MNEPERHLDDDECAALVLGIVPDPEYVHAIAHARTCVVCETRLRAHAGATVRARAVLATAGPLQVVRTRPGRPVARILAAVAAAAVIAVFLVRAPERPAGTAPEWLTTPGELVRTRSDVPIDNAMRTGLAAYARHDLQAAIAALRQAHVNGGAEQARRLYLGHALLATGNAKEARTWLESLDFDALPEPWRDEARHSLAAAWRLTGRSRQADSIENAPAR